MGRVALVGGSSNVGREFVDAIIKKGNHEVTICSGKPQPPSDLPSVVKWATVDYDDHSALVSAFRDIDTVISMISSGGPANLGFQAEKRIIDAAIEAGVSRIAPSQWAARSNNGIPHYAFKDKVAEYLAAVNSEKKIIQYSLFQPGYFLDYLAFPHQVSPHFNNCRKMFDFEKRRAIIMAGSENASITLTSVADTALVVASALDYSGPWPVIGGIRGTQTTPGEIIAFGEKLRGSFEVTRLDKESLQGTDFEVPWVPLVDHPSVPVEVRELVSKLVLQTDVISVANGEWSVSDEWNQLLGLKLTSMEELLSKYWS